MGRSQRSPSKDMGQHKDMNEKHALISMSFNKQERACFNSRICTLRVGQRPFAIDTLFFEFGMLANQDLNMTDGV